MANEPHRKHLIAKMEGSKGDRTFVATITTNAVDRDREVLLPTGLDAKDFLKNGPVFWNHNYDVPIGQTMKLSQGRDSWTAKARIADRPESHVGEWFPDTILALMQQGVVRGVSVGFNPVETRRATDRDKKEFGEDVERVHSKWKLLEFSVTPLPANQDALIQSVSKGIITPDRAKSMFGLSREPRPPAPRQKVYIVVPYQIAPPAPEPIDVKAIVGAEVKRQIARLTGRLT